MLLQVNHLKKVYGSQSQQTQALKSIQFGVKEGEFVAIMGESDSGKSTLLNIIATLDQATEGQVLINNLDTSQFNESQLAQFRRERLGFVFQDFNLLDSLSNQDNILLPLVLSNTRPKDMKNKLKALVPSLGITNLLDKYPYQISGGQKQRVAIGRALISQPDLILADEPTGALDSKSSQMIMELFQKINGAGQTILMVTHSLRSAAYAKRVLFIKDGIVYHEIYRSNQGLQTFQDRIADSLAVVNSRGE